MRTVQYKAGFIGCGNMASAIIQGMLNHSVLEMENIFVYDVDWTKTDAFPGVNVCAAVESVAERADIIYLCVKPNIVPGVLAEVKIENRAIVSIAAGLTVQKIKNFLPVGARVLRVMPNTPLLVGKGAIGVETPNDLLEDEKAFVYGVFSRLGLVREVSGEQMDAVTGVSGSGPAYVYLLADALAKAGEANGLSYETSLALSLQTFEGACEMLRQTKESPEKLIRNVCSPGGTTIEAMKVFEEKDVRGILRAAVDACVKRSGELSE